MPEKITTMPDCSIIPELEYADVAEAVEWLCNTFGFTERWRIGNHRAQLEYNKGVVVVKEPRGPNAAMPGYSVMMRVKDIDAHYEKVLKQGATILQEPADHFYGERQYTALDLGGHRWTFSQTIQVLAPEDWGASVPIK